MASAAASAAEAEEKPSQAEKEEVGFAFVQLREGSAEGLTKAEQTFSRAIERWRSLRRPRAELAQLLIARAKTRAERNELAGGTQPQLLEGAIEDFSEAVEAIRTDPQVPALTTDGRAAFQEYPDALVRRGLANEGLGRWQAAVADYTEAITLWGGVGNDFRPGAFSDGGRLGVNPYVLNFRGNALSRLGRFEEAVEDYRVAGQQFSAVRNLDALSVSLSNEALALYAAGRLEEAELRMRGVVRRSQNVPDMHAALAAIYWKQGRADLAESEWEYACNRTGEGCARYKDSTWVRGVRRWPPALADAMEQFMSRTNVAVVAGQ